MVFCLSSDSEFDFCSWFSGIWELGSTCSLVFVFFYVFSFFVFCESLILSSFMDT